MPFEIARLTSAIAPYRLYHFDRLASTNDKAAEMRRAGTLFAPAIVLADEQTAGRGRGHNRWFSSSASITVTYCLPTQEHLLPNQLPLVTGLAVRNAAAELTGHSAISLKWPNDVLYDGFKFAGILCECVGGINLVGIGLNVNVDDSAVPADVRERMTSLSLISHRDFDQTDTLIALTRHLQQMLQTWQSHPFATFLEAYRRHDALLGHVVQVNVSPDLAEICGVCEGLDSDGRLLVRDERQLHRIIAGSVRFDPYARLS